MKTDAINELFEAMSLRITELETQMANMPKGRDRGPSSEGKMTDEDAERILHGDLADVPHKKAAIALGRSYGQVYSARDGSTFKTAFKGSTWETKLMARMGVSQVVEA